MHHSYLLLTRVLLDKFFTRAHPLGNRAAGRGRGRWSNAVEGRNRVASVTSKVLRPLVGIVRSSHTGGTGSPPPSPRTQAGSRLASVQDSPLEPRAPRPEARRRPALVRALALLSRPGRSRCRLLSANGKRQGRHPRGGPRRLHHHRRGGAGRQPGRHHPHPRRHLPRAGRPSGQGHSPSDLTATARSPSMASASATTASTSAAAPAWSSRASPSRTP